MNNDKLHGYSWDYLASTMRPITECSVNMRKGLHERWNDLREKIDDNRVTDLFDNFQREPETMLIMSSTAKSPINSLNYLDVNLLLTI